MIICIDGPNCVGKSSIAKKIQETLNDIVVIEDYEMKEYVISENYLNARKIIQDKYKFQDKTKIFLIIRWFPSMYVFDYYKNDEKFLIDSKTLIVPDKTYIIMSSIKNIKNRRNLRENFHFNMSISKQIEKFSYYAEKYNIQCLINNSHNDVNKNAKLIIDAIKNEI